MALTPTEQRLVFDAELRQRQRAQVVEHLRTHMAWKYRARTPYHNIDTRYIKAGDIIIGGWGLKELVTERTETTITTQMYDSVRGGAYGSRAITTNIRTMHRVRIWFGDQLKCENCGDPFPPSADWIVCLKCRVEEHKRAAR